jgi:hypothetical protein
MHKGWREGPRRRIFAGQQRLLESAGIAGDGFGHIDAVDDPAGVAIVGAVQPDVVGEPLAGEPPLLHPVEQDQRGVAQLERQFRVLDEIDADLLAGPDVVDEPCELNEAAAVVDMAVGSGRTPYLRPLPCPYSAIGCILAAHSR